MDSTRDETGKGRGIDLGPIYAHLYVLPEDEL